MTNEDLTQIEETLDNAANALFDAINAPEGLREQYKQFSAHLNLAIHSASSPVKQKTKKEILEEAFGFYSEDPSRRAINTEGTCKYLMEDGRKCAVGRCLIEGKEIRYGSVKKDPIFAETQVKEIEGLDSCLLPEYRGHDVYFWQELQYWHDSCLNFTETGLSELGEYQAKHLLEKFADK